MKADKDQKRCATDPFHILFLAYLNISMLCICRESIKNEVGINCKQCEMENAKKRDKDECCVSYEYMDSILWNYVNHSDKLTHTYIYI